MVFAFVGAIPWFLQNNNCLFSPTVSLRPYMQFCATDFNLGVGTPWLFILHLFWQVVGSFVSIQLLQKDVSRMWCKSENFWLIKQTKMVMAAPMGHWYTCSFVSEGCAPKVLWILYLSKYPKDEFFWNFSPEFTETFFFWHSCIITSGNKHSNNKLRWEWECERGESIMWLNQNQRYMQKYKRNLLVNKLGWKHNCEKFQCNISAWVNNFHWKMGATQWKMQGKTFNTFLRLIGQKFRGLPQRSLELCKLLPRPLLILHTSMIRDYNQICQKV